MGGEPDCGRQKAQLRRVGRSRPKVVVFSQWAKTELHPSLPAGVILFGRRLALSVPEIIQRQAALVRTFSRRTLNVKEYHARMKALTLFLLCATPLLSQYVPPRVETGSRVPSVTIVPAGVDGTNYEFSVRNRSGHAVTALDILLIPDGVPKKDGQFECKDQCSDDPKIGNIDLPVIAAGGELKVKYETARVSRGAVIVQAAIFDNASYGGDEQSSTLLIAIQLGNQDEFDRIISVVRSFVADEDYDSEKGSEIQVALTALPVNADSETITAFGRWFPNIRDCSHRFPRIMQEASTEERNDVIKKLQPLLRTGNPSKAALTAWWSATQDYMSAFGCPACGARMANPRPPVT
jgi:hypothetical protein